ncbi:alkaline phytoceramidase [Nitrosovibrio sp. Nv4]|uniref:alkaline phytoceramidase n=1 Tax=Nitrosovibrio sp. Nv4 TaxID=1945880 RepID=UPI000BD740D1|nr:alkaline phytoceramidase [Nitrosovibrio sp. Nv4]SOD42095.1 Ceramidase [Nitrosovibrio sp. Nv4]
MNDKRRLWMLSLLSAGMLLLAVIIPPIPQPLEYHQFADQRTYFGIPNFFNVVSNVAFLLVGIAGLGFLLCSGGARIAKAFVDSSERWPYLVLFLNVAMACIGSAYYHLAPGNERLMWDRLPIAIGIMALLAAALNERVNPKAGLLLLPVLIAVGVGSVMHWHWSKQRGAGNLNFYIVVQFYSLLVIILLGIYFPSRYTHGSGIYMALAFYAIAKLAEIGDRAIYDIGQVISGHTVKHLLAAAAIYLVVRMLRKRRPLP